jgi:plastocyanin
MNARSFCTGLLLSSTIALAGDIAGQVVITKHFSKKAIAPAVYNLRGAAPAPETAKPEPVNEFERVVVWLEGGNLSSNAPVTASIDQRDIDFSPDLLVIPVGSTIEFPNSDPIFHNVFSLSRAQPFDLGFYPRGKSRAVKFTRKGIVQVYCHLHAKMYAVIVVTSSPWYGKPSPEGSFSWTGVPAGKYRLMAWHKVAGLCQTEVTVPADGLAQATLQIPLDMERGH